jgi:tetratricopeptide (TPR) repeat protein
MRSFYIYLTFLPALVFFTACDDSEYEKADRYFRQGDYDKAIDHYNEYLEYQPGHLQSVYNRGRAYEEMGNYEKALSSYREALDIAPDNTNALMSIGKYHYRNKNFSDAAHYFGRAAKEANVAEAFFLHGRALHKSGQTEKAMDAYNNALNINSDHGQAYLYRGALKVFMGRKSSGCNDFKLASSLGIAEAEKAMNEYCQ